MEIKKGEYTMSKKQEQPDIITRLTDPKDLVSRIQFLTICAWVVFFIFFYAITHNDWK